MKSIILSFLLIFHFAPDTIAQDLSGNSQKWPIEISMSGGRTSIVTLMEGVYGGEDGYSSRPINTYSGTFSCTIRYVISRRFSIGVGMAYENETGNMAQFVNSSNNGPITANQGTFQRNVFSIAPEGLFHYTRENNGPISVYGYFGIGYSILNELDTYSPAYYNGFYYNGINSLGNNREALDNHTEVTVQICPIGLSFGRRLRGFAELGFGYKGIVNAGLSLKL